MITSDTMTQKFISSKEIQNSMKEIAILKNDLEELYVTKYLSTIEIAKHYNCDDETIRQRLIKYGIKRRENNISTIRKISIPTDENKMAYFAGIIDGEGNIIFLKSKNARDGFLPRVAVKNTDKKLMDWIVKNFGATYYTSKPPKKHPGYKTSYQWHTDSTLDIYYLLKAVLPYLIIKKKNGLKIFEYCRNKMEEK